MLRHSGLFACSLGCLFAWNAAQILMPGAIAQEGGKPPTDSVKKANFHIIQLKHVKAEDAIGMLRQLFNKDTANLVSDARTNAILVSAPDEAIVGIREVLKKIDVDSDAGPMPLQVVQLRSIEPDKALEEALGLIIKAGGNANFAIDRPRKQVVISGDKPTIDAATALLARLDQGMPGQVEEDVQVRVVWLVNESKHDEGTQPIPDDLKEVIPSLSKLGIAHPHLAAQTLVNVTPNFQFQAKGIARLSGPCKFSVSGRYSTKKEAPSLEITIWATSDVQKAEHEICDLQTEISAPPGHLVVLGVTPTDTTTSVFVVQVIGKKAGRK